MQNAFLRACQAPKTILTVDWETFYDTSEKYSLSSMTAEEYINDPRFEPILLSVKVNAEPAVWKSCGDPDFEEWLHSFPWRTSVVVAHNGSFFDFLFMCWKYDIIAGFYICTLLLARPLNGQQQSNSLAGLAERMGLRAKGTEVHNANGKHLCDFTEAELNAYGDYCALDSDLCYEVLARLLPEWTPYSIRWMNLTMRMYIVPQFKLNQGILEDGIRAEERKKGRQLLELEMILEETGFVFPEERRRGEDKKMGYYRIPMKKLVGSGDQFASILRHLGVEPPTKVSDAKLKTARKKRDADPSLPSDIPAEEVMTYAFARTDPFMQEVLEIGDDRKGVDQAVQARVGVKSTIAESRLTRMLGTAKRMGCIPMPVRAFAAHTGRAGGAEKNNPQNYPSRPTPANPGGKANPTRLAIEAPPDHVVVDIDQGQIEVRVSGGLAGEHAILDVFSDPDADPYCTFGETLYGRRIIKGVDKFERNVSKSAVLGNGFGQGGAGFQGYCRRSGIKLDLEECIRIVRVYRAANPALVEFWAECEWALNRIIDGYGGTFGYRGCLKVVSGAIILPSGRPQRYPQLERFEKYDERFGRDVTAMRFYDPQKRMMREVYGSLCTENLTQGCAADVVFEQAVDIAYETGFYPALQCHDALTWVPHKRDLPRLLKAAKKIMTEPREWMDWIPLAVEADIGPSYGSMLEEAKYFESLEG